MAVEDEQNVQPHISAKLEVCLDALTHGMDIGRTARQHGHQIITLGCGGSAMTTLHFITD